MPSGHPLPKGPAGHRAPRRGLNTQHKTTSATFQGQKLPRVFASTPSARLSLSGEASVVVPTAARAYLGLAGAFAIATLADGSQAAHLETGIQGMTVIDAKLVSQAAQNVET